MRKFAWTMLLVFSFTIPWELSLDLGAPVGSIARIAGLVLLLAVVPAVLQAGQIRTPGSMQWMVLALLLWSGCSGLWSIDTPATLERLRAYAQVMMTVWLVWELAESPEDVRNLMRAYVAGSWVLAILTIADFASPDAAGQVRFAAEGQDPNDVARFLDLAFPMAALLLNSESRWWGRVLAIGYLPLGVAGVLLTASRSGFLAASIAIAGCGFLLGRSHRRAVVGGGLAMTALAAVLLFTVPHAIIERISTIPEQLANGDLNQRLNIWTAGWRAFVHAPLLGTGAGSFVDAAQLAQIDTAHNTALALAVEGGLVALALACGIVVVAARCVLLTRGSSRIGLGTALIVLIVTSLVATVEGNRSTWFLLALISVAGRFATADPAGMWLQFETTKSPARQLKSVETTA
jgi:O-antigen ligase